MKKNRLVLIAATAIATTPAHAAEFLGTEWAGSGELGYVATTGNTDTSTLTARVGLVYERDRWRHSLGLDALKAEDDSETTAERYFAAWQSDYKLTEQNYLFGRLTYEDDKFNGYEYRSTETLGYGRRVIDTEDMSLDLEIGPGARQSKPEDASVENELILRLAGHYAWQVSDNAKFTQELSADVGEDATVSRSVTALQADIVNNLAMKISFTAKHTTDVPDDVDKTDTETAVTLVYGF